MVRATITALVALWASSALAQELPSAGRVAAVTGGAFVQHTHAGAAADVALHRGDVLHEGDVVRTTAGATLRVLMADKSMLDLGESSRVSLARYSVNARERKASIKLWVGKLWARVASSLVGEKSFEVSTGNAVAGVRGTEFGVSRPSEESNAATVYVDSGGVEVSIDGGPPQLVGPGEGGSIGAGFTKTTDKSLGDSVRVRVQLMTLGGDGAALAGELGLDQGAPTDGGTSPLEDTGAPLDLDPGSGFVGSDRARVHGTIRLQE